ncbi:MAG: RNA polymerase sigma-70 factor ECF subfamily [Puniceicoccaceae bacterium 5H]|nr:MAG: RNA polymerase sigma-70 factor ECF subfamily [Puniceicoccaceae bacterium 5H]
MDDDLAVLQRLQRGEGEALNTLIERYRQPVYRLAWRYLHLAHEAEDVAEETFVRVYFKAAQFRPRGKVSTWIFAIAANLCRDTLRRRRKDRQTQSIDLEPEDAPQDTLADPRPRGVALAEQREQLEAVEAAIERLPHKLKFPFVFCVLEERSQDECAEVLKTSRKTVETRIYRARQFLRDTLAAN